MGPMGHYFCRMVHASKINGLKLAGSVARSSPAAAAEPDGGQLLLLYVVFETRSSFEANNYLVA